MNAPRTEAALQRIRNALDRIESVGRPGGAAARAQFELMARHSKLRAEITAAVTEIDAMINEAADD